MHNDVQYPIIRYTLTLEDYRRFRFYHNRKQAIIWLIYFFLLFAATAFIAGAEGVRAYAVVPVGLLVCLAIAAVMWVFHLWNTSRQYKNNPFLRQEQTVEGGPGGFRVLTSSSDLTIRWKEIKSVKEIHGYYSIYFSQDQGFVIPASLVNGAAFRRMIAQHIPSDRCKFIL